MPRSFFTPRWILTTLLVIAAVGVMVRLGIWQLDRLDQRRAFNTRVQAQIDSAPLDLSAALAAAAETPEDLIALEYRRVVVRGEYHPDEQVILRNQVWEDQPGSHLMTPLYLQNSNYVILVDRGWIPLGENDPAVWQKYNQAGLVEVSGELRLSQDARRFGSADPIPTPGGFVPAWNAVRLARISNQVQGELLPVYLQAGPVGAQTTLPYAQVDAPDLSEGPHMNYAIQWFSFALILALGYPFFIKKQLS